MKLDLRRSEGAIPLALPLPEAKPSTRRPFQLMYFYFGALMYFRSSVDTLLLLGLFDDSRQIGLTRNHIERAKKSFVKVCGSLAEIVDAQDYVEPARVDRVVEAH